MKKLILRIILVMIIFPLLYLLIFILVEPNFLALNILFISFTFIGSFELVNIFNKIGIYPFKYTSSILSITIIVATYIEVYYLPEFKYFSYIWLALALGFIQIRSIFSINKNNFLRTLPVISSTSFIIIYPGFFMSFLTRILSFNNPKFIFLFYVSLVFSNEIMSYLFGSLFGKNTRLGLFISPNKTLVGFIAGLLGSLGVSILFYYFLPDLFSKGLFFVMLFGGIIGLSSIIGDLFESTMKRSANLKDSGTIMLGRGGIMDTIDALLLSAPIFYLIYPFIA